MLSPISTLKKKHQNVHSVNVPTFQHDHLYRLYYYIKRMVQGEGSDDANITRALKSLIKLTYNLDTFPGYICNSSLSPSICRVSIVSFPQGKL